MAKRKRKATSSVGPQPQQEDQARVAATEPLRKEGTEFDEDHLLARLHEEQIEARENRSIWRAFREAPGWVTAVLLVLVTAIQLLATADGSIEIATAIASSMDTSRIFLLAAVVGIVSLGGLLPIYFFAYFRHELALRYRDIALAKAANEKLHDSRILSARLRGMLQWLLLLMILTSLFAPAWVSGAVLVLLLRGGINALRSPFAPRNFWTRLEAQGHLKRPPDQLSEVIKAKVEVSNLHRMNGMFVTIILTIVIYFIMVPDIMLPTQEIKMRDGSILVGSVLGSTPTGLAVLANEPKRVLVGKPTDVNSVRYCRSSQPTLLSDRTLLDIVQGDQPWRLPSCGPAPRSR